MHSVVSDKSSVQDFLALCALHGMRNVVLCPGSRNAPFSISLFGDTRFNTFSIPDERSAAFVALGLAQQTQIATVLICTSGTASLNFAPAIAEAYYQRVPLLVVTADRPIEWIDQGEGQSIRQKNIFVNYIKASFEIQEEAIHPDIVWHNNRIMDEAMRLASEGVAGPVHINFPLREPLYKTVPLEMKKVKRVERIKSSEVLHSDTIRDLTEQIEASTKVLILAGQHAPHYELHEALRAWTAHSNVVVFTEAHSNLADEAWCSAIDRTISGLDAATLQAWYPDILITFGHNIISRKVKDWLRKGTTNHWHVDVSGEGLDTLKQLKMIIPMQPSSFFKAVSPRQCVDSDYATLIVRHSEKRERLANAFIEQAPWCDLTAFKCIYDNIPAQYALQMGNSSVVRYILLMNARGDLAHFGNRGVAGIDGCTSTAVGATWATQRPTLLVSGDVAFFYDSNAFWNNYVSKHLKIIVINNQGGGIFRIIDGPSTSPAMKQYFETTHNRSAKGLAAMYDLPFQACSDLAGLKDGLKWLWSMNNCAILEVLTPQELNDVVLKDYFHTIQNN